MTEFLTVFAALWAICSVMTTTGWVFLLILSPTIRDAHSNGDRIFVGIACTILGPVIISLYAVKKLPK